MSSCDAVLSLGAGGDVSCSGSGGGGRRDEHLALGRDRPVESARGSGSLGIRDAAAIVVTRAEQPIELAVLLSQVDSSRADAVEIAWWRERQEPCRRASL
jgi:hypothetical protein